ncbi:MAG TPA: SBBP repeat-containing protein [Acidobacteriota bacterium]
MNQKACIQVRLVEALPVLKAAACGFLLLVCFQHAFRLPGQSVTSSTVRNQPKNVAPARRPAPTQIRANTRYGKLPLSFEANCGQADSTVKFLARGPGYRLFLTARETVLVLGSAGTGKTGVLGAAVSELRTGTKQENRKPEFESVLGMKLVGANPKPRISGLEELPGKSNYFIGDHPSDWKTNIPNYARVKYSGVYPGVDLIYYGKEGQLEYDLVVAPHVDPGIISIKFDQSALTRGGARAKHTALEIDSDGDLLLHTAWGDLRQHKPHVYQEVNGARREIAGHYVFKRTSVVGFQVANYDRGQPLVLDPALSYSTYLGGSFDDSGNSIAVDSSGNAYVTGFTGSINFPTANAFQRTRSTAFVTKLNPQGSGFVYSTFLGGSGTDRGNAIAVDPSGNVYVTGSTTSTNFPAINAFQTTNRGGSGGDAFVAKLNNFGSALLYSTYLGGTGNGKSLIDSGDKGRGMAVDSAGNAYVTGTTDSANFPTRNPFQATYGGGDNDAFVAKFDPTGGLLYSTFLGGGDKESSVFAFATGGNPIAVDSAGNAYVAGTTLSTNFPTTPGSFQRAFIPSPFGIGIHGFVTKLNASGSALVYSTFLEGTFNDYANGIAVDSSGNAYVTGQTGSPDFPVTFGVYRSTLVGGLSDAFVTKINPSGSGLIFSTFLGGDGFSDGGDEGKSIALDSAGNIYVAGHTTSLAFPLANPIQSSYAGPVNKFFFPPVGDVFVTKFNPSGSRILFSTYLGGSDYDFVGGIAADSSGSIYLAGSTRSSNFPTAKPLQATFGGSGGNSGPSPGGDAFVAKIDPTPGPGEMLPPIADAPWTRSIRIDSNQNGVPDQDDETLNVQRIQSGQNVSLRFISPLFGTSDIALSNPNSQGRFQTATRRQQNLAGTTRTTTVTLDQFDANQRAISVSITHEIVKGTTTTRFTGKVTAVDENGDGIIDYFTGSETGQPAIRGSVVFYDVNGDGKPDFVSIPWAMAGGLGANSGDPQIFVPLADTNGDGIPDSPAFDFDNDGKPDPEFLISPLVAGRITPIEQKIYFAQFGDGAVSGGQIISQISLFNPDTTRAASARITIRDDAGNPITVALNGEVVTGQKDLTVPPGGLRILRTPGQGPLTVGSLTVTSDKVLAGVIVFGGSIGFTGVGSSALQVGGFVAPIETNTVQGTSTGIAMLSLESSDMAVDLQLVDAEGKQVATSHLDAASKAGDPAGAEELKAGGHLARFVTEFNWSPPVDFSNFAGTLKASFTGKAAATVLKTQPGQLTTLPVAPILTSASPGSQLQRLLFAQFGDGAISGGQIVSQISLFNLDPTGPATVSVLIRDDSGKPITVALNGETVSGQKNLTIPASGLRVLRTAGTGPLTVGSVTVISNTVIAGVIVFGGSIGFTGVGSSAPQFTAFLAPMEANTAQATSTGIAVMNLETTDVTADLQLLDSEGRQVATSRLDGANAIKASGHLAHFVTEFTWSPAVDFSSFSGVLKVTASGRVAATVLKTQPGQLTTLPVAPKTN